MADPGIDDLAFLDERDAARAWEGFLRACLGTVERAVRRVAIDAEEARDVVAEVLARIHADWPALIRRYAAGRTPDSTGFRPWLAVVARRLAIDVLRSLHGRPTPPRAVLRMPPVRQRLFQLLYRERRRLEEAFDLLVASREFAGSFVELALEVRALEDALPAEARAAAATPRRPARARGGDADGAGAEPPDRGAERPADQCQRRSAHAEFLGILADLRAEDRLLLRAYYLEDASAADVARLTGASGARAVYSRVQDLLERLRQALERRGLGPEDLGLLVDFDWTSGLAPRAAEDGR